MWNNILFLLESFSKNQKIQTNKKKKKEKKENR